MNIKQQIIRYHYISSIIIIFSSESLFLKLDFILLLSGGKLLPKCSTGIVKVVLKDQLSIYFEYIPLSNFELY